MSLFITFEGPDGGGKSTICRTLAGELQATGYQVLVLREPGGTPIGDQVRQVLMDKANTSMTPHAEFLLFSASRAQLVRQTILPALSAGKIVLCDRFFHSSFAYQGFGHGLNLADLQQVTEFATGGLHPHATLLFDIDAESGLRRRQKPGLEWNRLDDYAVEFHRRVREGYLQLASADPNHWYVLDASQSYERVLAQARQHIALLLQNQ